MFENRKIAIVDDHKMFRKGLCVLIDLMPSHKVILEASNGEEFIQMLNKEELPDIVLMDITMPIKDGYSTTHWLTINYPEIKVLALSTMDAEHAIIKMIRCGAKGYILKDSDPEDLALAFNEVEAKGYYYNEIVTRKVLGLISQIAENVGNPNTFLKLNDREIEFLKLCCTELSYKEISEQMNLSVRTVEGYRDSLCDKLNVKGRIGLAIYAIKNGLVTI